MRAALAFVILLLAGCTELSQTPTKSPPEPDALDWQASDCHMAVGFEPLRRGLEPYENLTMFPYRGLQEGMQAFWQSDPGAAALMLIICPGQGPANMDLGLGLFGLVDANGTDPAASQFHVKWQGAFGNTEEWNQIWHALGIANTQKLSPFWGVTPGPSGTAMTLGMDLPDATGYQLTDTDSPRIVARGADAFAFTFESPSGQHLSIHGNGTVDWIDNGRNFWTFGTQAHTYWRGDSACFDIISDDAAGPTNQCWMIPHVMWRAPAVMVLHLEAIG